MKYICTVKEKRNNDKNTDYGKNTYDWRWRRRYGSSI